MPVSEKQRNANRQNAQKSTGPKTDEGKKRSALNGSRHNLTGAAYVMSDEDRKAFDAFSGPFTDSFKPANAAERSCAHLIAVAHWRLNRAHAMEENTFSLGHYTRAGEVDIDHAEIHHALTQARVFDFKGDFFKNLSLYEQRIAREMHRNLKDLFELQDRRKAEERDKAREQALEAAREAAKPKTKTATASTTSEQSGFAFSTTQTPPSEHSAAPETAPHPPGQPHSFPDPEVREDKKAA